MFKACRQKDKGSRKAFMSQEQETGRIISPLSTDACLRASLHLTKRTDEQESGRTPEAGIIELSPNEKEIIMNHSAIPFRELSNDYLRIEQAIKYLEKHYKDQPGLEEIAASIGLSEFHFQRLFTRWAGVSPKRFLQYLTKEGAKEFLIQSENLLDTTYKVGLSSLGRLHDLFVTTEAVTPGEYKSHGAGLTIRYGIHPTPFGECLIGVTDRGICHLGFVLGNEGQAIDALVSEWQQAEMIEDHRATAPLIAPIFILRRREESPLHLHMRGTNFQLKVWEALLRIPLGAVTTYSSLASRIGQPGAARAVGTAVGHNPIAVLIPCHRVIRQVGEFGNYRYGSSRKMALLGSEFAKSEDVEARPEIERNLLVTPTAK
jgi:AraC family transcriptional regulator, regulatory protein of adaptative response / methylated-DNA-[protein]-cysteine methyltransferase